MDVWTMDGGGRGGGWRGGWAGGWADGQVDRWMDEWMDGQWMGGRMGWLNKDDDQMNHPFFNYLHKCYLHTEMALDHLKVKCPNHPATRPPLRFLTALF